MTALENEEAANTEPLNITRHFLLSIAMITVWIVIYMNGLPDEVDNYTAFEIDQLCIHHQADNNDIYGGNRICDVQSLLDDSEKSEITSTILEVEQQFSMAYSETNYLRNDNSNHIASNDDEKLLHHEQQKGISYNQANLRIKVVLVGQLEDKGVPFFISNEKCEYIADKLLDKWGVTSTEPQEHILLLLAQKEMISCISHTPGLSRLLTEARIDDVSEHMDELYWWYNDVDMTKGIMYSLKRLSGFLQEGKPTFWDKYGWYFVVCIYISYFCIRPQMRQNWIISIPAASYRQLSEEEKTKATSLMKQYDNYSCPICLEEYISEDDDEKANLNQNYNSIQNSTDDNNNNNKYLGSDKEAIKLLRCGHSTCQRCWNEWEATNLAENPRLCPVCRRDIGG